MAKSIQLKNIENENYYPYALLKEFVLYNDINGTNETVNLSDDVSNYKYIEIFFRNNDNQQNNVKIYDANNKYTTLLSGFVTEGVYVLKSARVQIMGNKIIKLSYCEGDLRLGSGLKDNSNNTYINRVVGYK